MRSFCDHCGKEVLNGECNILAARNIDENDDAEIMIACKFGCTDKVDPKKQMANQELGQCVLHLTVNAKIDVHEEMETATQMYNAFGLIF
jgi:hypothetical protein